MCSRYPVTSKPEKVRAHFSYLNEAEFPARESIAPTEPIMIIRELVAKKREMALVRWGLIPYWVKDPDNFTLIINARCETLLEKPSFKTCIAHKRCIIPADGFYEWSGPRGSKQPHLVKPSTEKPIGFAGLWDHWQGKDGTEFESAAIITVPANDHIGQIHDRMPAILNKSDYDHWLNVRDISAKDVIKLLRTAPNENFEIVDLERSPRREQTTKPKKPPAQGELF